MYTYNAKVIKVVDGDTIDAMIDLGFDTWVAKTIRLDGINAPESRTRNLDEKKRGLATKERLIQLLEENGNVFKLISHGTEKFGRCLGEVFVNSQGDLSIQSILITEGLAVEYHGEKRK